MKLCVKELYSWNLACFRHPRHPEMRKLETIKQGSEAASKVLEITSKKYIVLTFPGPTGPAGKQSFSNETVWTEDREHSLPHLEKEEFCKEFDSLATLRDVDQSNYNRTLMEKKHKANNPGSPGLLRKQPAPEACQEAIVDSA